MTATPSIIEITDKARIEALLADRPRLHLEAIDENALGVDGIVTIFCADEPRPLNMMIVRWGQGASHGVRSIAHLQASSLTGLEPIVKALPNKRAQYDAHVPFWASPALSSAFTSQMQGAIALYVADADRLRPSPVAPQCKAVDDRALVQPMFRKLADDGPAYALALDGALGSVAVTTHLRGGFARITTYTVDTFRGRGFGRGALTALASALLDSGVTPTALVDLADEPSVRMVEAAGFYQVDAFLKARLADPFASAGDGLVQLGSR